MTVPFILPTPLFRREFRRKRHSQKSIVTTRPFSLTCKYLQGSENGRVVTIEPEIIGDLLICIFKIAAQREFGF